MKTVFMKTKYLLLRLLVSLTTVLNTSYGQTQQKPDWAGIWLIVRDKTKIDSSINKDNYPFLKGILRLIKWSKFEPDSTGNFQWNLIDSHLIDAVNRGLNAMVGIIVAPDPPRWLFDKDVPEIVTAFHDSSSFPYYLHPVFKAEFKRMISAVAQHVQTYQGEMRTKLIAVQAPVGASGDPHPYKTEPGEGARDAGGSFLSPRS